ncbi:hypothetical protein BpHYR1_024500 [Brachionus plicatilis]|uniref:Uncharacterized protein n=1 Tax=Brachionus plicatilis TaxID=10195 RepID=A0A3M7R239_BRAPC|nr:hypothetical protein BpHYR1_024500 [Brachionus plicatilis]
MSISCDLHSDDKLFRSRSSLNIKYYSTATKNCFYVKLPKILTFFGPEFEEKEITFFHIKLK